MRLVVDKFKPIFDHVKIIVIDFSLLFHYSNGIIFDLPGFFCVWNRLQPNPAIMKVDEKRLKDFTKTLHFVWETPVIMGCFLV